MKKYLLGIFIGAFALSLQAMDDGNNSQALTNREYVYHAASLRHDHADHFIKDGDDNVLGVKRGALYGGDQTVLQDCGLCQLVGGDRDNDEKGPKHPALWGTFLCPFAWYLHPYEGDNEHLLEVTAKVCCLYETFCCSCLTLCCVGTGGRMCDPSCPATRIAWYNLQERRRVAPAPVVLVSRAMQGDIQAGRVTPNTQCGICKSGEDANYILPCGHAFHQACINRKPIEDREKCSLCNPRSALLNQLLLVVVDNT